MPRSRGRHLSKENREVIEDGVRDGRAARRIAALLDVAASTVTHEVKTNRTITEPKRRRGANLAVRCGKYSERQSSGSACRQCSTKLTTCKHCKTRNCIDSCPGFELKMCPVTLRWPYVCPGDCKKRSTCTYPKRRYGAVDADAAYHARLVSSREGIDVSPEELESMKRLVVPLAKQGQSFEAIWISRAGEPPCGVRTACAYQEKGLLGLADPHLPRKVRMKKRKRAKEKGRERVDRAGRTFECFEQLPLVDKVRVVQRDSAEGYEHNEHDVFSLRIVARAFRVYPHKQHGSPEATVTWLDVLERAFGSREAFGAVFGILLCDRGVELDSWEAMEGSCLEPGRRRCRVSYCDAMNSNQESEAERNHEQLRRTLPKARSDFDALDVFDAAVCCSHVSSYPSAGRSGKCPFELLGDLLPSNVLDELGLARIPADEVIPRPSLMRRAVVQWALAEYGNPPRLAVALSRSVREAQACASMPKTGQDLAPPKLKRVVSGISKG